MKSLLTLMICLASLFVTGCGGGNGGGGDSGYGLTGWVEIDSFSVLSDDPENISNWGQTSFDLVKK